MNLLFWGLTIGVIGKVLLGIGVILAHTSLAHEKKIDSFVLKSFRLEHEMTIVGIILILIGYFMEIYFYGFTPLLTCTLEECGQAAAIFMAQ